MLKVIGAGFGRTGTASMKAALDHIGLGRTYHMLEIIAQPERMRAWARVADGEQPDWHDIFAGFQSTVDWPGAAYWRELSETFPEAKVLLTVRDPDRWYDSVHSTIYQFAKHTPDLGVGTTVNKMVWDGTFGGRFEDRAHAIRVFEEHNAAVQAAVPADRLLVHRTGDGWGPLCDFLGVDVPDQDFPHVNDSGSVRDLATRAATLGEVPDALT